MVMIKGIIELRGTHIGMNFTTELKHFNLNINKIGISKQQESHGEKAKQYT